MPDPRFEAGTPFTDTYLHQIEVALGRKLPPAYRAFAKENGGCFVGGCVDGLDSLPVLSFFGCDERNGVIATLRQYSDLRVERALPVADCALGNIYVLDHDDAVHYINYYGGRTTATKVSVSFSDFVMRIVVEDEE